MSYVRRVALLVTATVAAALLSAAPAAAATPAAARPAPATAKPAAAPPPAAPAGPQRVGAEPPEARRHAGGAPEWTGTYQRVARDVVRPDGTIYDVYDDRLVVGAESYRIRLPKGTKLDGGTRVRVRGRVSGLDMTADEVTRVAAAPTVATTGTTKVLVILVYWSSPDTMTVTKARNQVFGDDHGWFGEVSYGKLGLSGDVSGWHKITAPTPGRCYSEMTDLMTRGKAKAKAAGYDSAGYARTILYFPTCGGDASGYGGWAYQPGESVWLNGYLDRRISTHEQGHNYGLPHAHAAYCSSGGTRTTFSGACSSIEYGDDYDTMGGSNYAAHFSAPQKDRLGWLGTRKRSLPSTATTVTLTPLERTGTTPVAAVATAGGTNRKYWFEYRQPVGYDNALPAGATSGVQVRTVDVPLAGDDGPVLLDVSPHDGLEHAVVPSGGAWTSPDGVRVTVGGVTADGATITVQGGVDPPTVPSAPRNVSATGGDGSVRLTWDPPSSNGGSSVSGYVVTSTPGDEPLVVGGTSATVGMLTNGTEYAFTVAARNSVGTGPASAAVRATPTVQLPNVVLTSPLPGSTATGPITLTASATPNELSGAAIDFVSFAIDGHEVGWAPDAPFSAQVDPTFLDDGPHEVTATAYDTNFRYRTSDPVTIDVVKPRPSVAITAPADGAVVTRNLVELAATSAEAPGTGSPILWVTYELLDGTVVGYGSGDAPHAAEWDTTGLHGQYQLLARVYDAEGRSGASPPVTVTIQHPVPSVVMTAPAEAATVSGIVVLAAEATPNPETLAPVTHVDFHVGSTYLGTDYDAPFEQSWDSRSLAGEQVVSATAYDSLGNRAPSPGRTVFLDNPLPTVAVTSPAPGATVTGTVTLTAAAQPNPAGAPLAGVDMFVDGFLVASVDAPGPYTTTWDATGLYGPHTVTAVARDTEGRSAQSAPVVVTVPQPKPSIAVTSPADGATVRAGQTTIAATAAPDATTQAPVWYVEFFVDGAYVGSDADPTDGFATDWYLDPGERVLTARAYDTDNFAADAPTVTVTAADPPGAPAGVSATAGADGTATVTWTAPVTGDLPVLDYVVRAGDGTERTVAGSPATVTGLTNGTKVTFQVKARSAVGFGPLSAASVAVTPGTRTALSIAVTPASVLYGKSVTVTGALTAAGTPLSGRTVQLLACTPGSATACAVAKTATTAATTGKVTFTYAPRLHRDLRLRYVAPPGDRYLASGSVAKKVTVGVVVTSAVSRTSLVLGKTVTVSGRVTPAHSGKRVYLQRYTSTGWKSVLYKDQSSTGYVAWTVKPATKGTHRYRLYFAGDADHLKGYSPTRTVTVTAS